MRLSFLNGQFMGMLLLLCLLSGVLCLVSCVSCVSCVLCVLCVLCLGSLKPALSLQLVQAHIGKVCVMNALLYEVDNGCVNEENIAPRTTSRRRGERSLPR